MSDKQLLFIEENVLVLSVMYHELREKIHELGFPTKMSFAQFAKTISMYFADIN
jgi:hypothetical protein